MASMTTDRAADAYGALRHLKDLPFVDGDRVALMGRSHGGWTTLEAMASRHYRSSLTSSAPPSRSTHIAATRSPNCSALRYSC